MASSPDPQLTQTISVGRMVHYVARGSADGAYLPECRAAIVTEVTDQRLGIIGLAVLNPTGLFFNTGVRYSPGSEPGSWHWPERV